MKKNKKRLIIVLHGGLQPDWSVFIATWLFTHSLNRFSVGQFAIFSRTHSARVHLPVNKPN